MKLYPIESQNFKLDGGAMFGVVPKSLWQKTNPADANNMIDIAARCLLIEDGKRLILVDTGLGNKQTDKFFGYYHLWGDYQLEASLKQHGFHPDDITDVFLTHLHFDHCGGAVSKNPQSGVLRPSFKNAMYWSNADHWQWATQPNAREKASFLPENILPIQESGQLQMISPDKSQFLTHVPDINLSVFFADGHTEKQMIPIVTYQNKKIAFMADLLPTTGHIPLPYVMGYDTRPLLTLAEKEIFLNYAADQELFLFLEHDAHHQMITVTHTDKGVRLDKTYTCEEIL
ncbi:MAG: MBL fold metallo-hydrolase [Bacteroidetes bacterium]|nr:MBL fold metallo-hydrolase [Bacteroidota bacterium]